MKSISIGFEQKLTHSNHHRWHRHIDSCTAIETILDSLLRWSMYHGDMNERQHSELHMVRKEGGRLKIWRLPVLVRFTATFPFPLFPHHV